MFKMSKKTAIENAVKIIEHTAKDGDVINVVGHAKFWDIPMKIGFAAIKKAQYELFEEPEKYGDYCPNDDSHSMMFFRKKLLEKSSYKNVTTFSVEPPKAKFIPTEKYAMKDITIWRYTKKKFSKSDVEILLKAAEHIIGTKYDFGQLLDIAINQILGYPFDDKIKWFDFGNKQKVCSVGVATIFEKFRNETKSIDRLFSKLNFRKWSGSMIKKFYSNGGRWDIEQTYPANFSNSATHFNTEFKLVLRMRKGKVLFPVL